MEIRLAPSRIMPTGFEIVGNYSDYRVPIVQLESTSEEVV